MCNDCCLIFIHFYFIILQIYLIRLPVLIQTIFIVLGPDTPQDLPYVVTIEEEEKDARRKYIWKIYI